MAEIRIRDGRPEDADGIARVQVATWRSTYRGIVPDDILDSLSYQDRAARRRQALEQPGDGTFDLVADAGAKVIGWAAAGPERGDFPDYDAEVYALYVLADYQGQGIGRRLVDESVRRLTVAGHRSLLIWVLADNPSRSFYAHLGGSPVAEQTVTIGVPLREIGYGWEDMTALGHPE